MNLEKPEPSGGPGGWPSSVMLWLLVAYAFGNITLPATNAPAVPVAPGATVGAECTATESAVEDRNSLL